jgi:hypothetical protein
VSRQQGEGSKAPQQNSFSVTCLSFIWFHRRWRNKEFHVSNSRLFNWSNGHETRKVTCLSRKNVREYWSIKYLL